MYIEQISLKNYRNYEQLELAFENKVNVILGKMLKEKQMSWNPFMFWQWQNLIELQMIKNLFAGTKSMLK